MSIFDIFPWTNMHELNLDWVIATVARLSKEWDSLKDSLDPKIAEAVDQWFTEHPEQADALRVANEALGLSEQTAAVVDTVSKGYSSMTVTADVNYNNKTAVLVAAMPRDKIETIGICNNNGTITTDADINSVYDYMLSHDDDVAINCDYSPSKMMLNGVIFGSTDRWNVFTYTAFNPDTQSFKIYNKGTPFTSIQADGYNYIFGSSIQLIADGVPRTSDRDEYVNPLMAMGWSDTHIYIAVALGRTPTFEGSTLPQIRDALLNAGAYNAVNLDGGGSSQFIYRANGCVFAANGAQDNGGTFRTVPLNIHFKFKEGLK